jgi:hypothetical protein
MNTDFTPTSAPENRRAALRLRTEELPLRIEGAHGASGDATLIDISRTGLRFRCSLDLPIGAEVVVHAPAHSGLAALRTRISRRIDPDQNAGAAFEYGAAFADPGDENRHAWFLNLRKAA